MKKQKVSWVTLDDREISKEAIKDYNKRLDSWRERYKDNITSFEAAMDKPNPPNYFRANND